MHFMIIFLIVGLKLIKVVNFYFKVHDLQSSGSTAGMAEGFKRTYTKSNNIRTWTIRAPYQFSFVRPLGDRDFKITSTVFVQIFPRGGAIFKRFQGFGDIGAFEGIPATFRAPFPNCFQAVFIEQCPAVNTDMFNSWTAFNLHTNRLAHKTG